MTNVKKMPELPENVATPVRCGWVSTEQIYIDYHDNEWGVPQYDSQKLFEKICLEGQQAGLSWITVLKKRDCYRASFHQFDPAKIAKMTEADLDKLMQESGLIRHRLKLQAIVKNARAYMKMRENGEDFSQFIWSFVNGKPQINHHIDFKDAPTQTEVSDAMAKALKKRGFTFVGSTICYAYMQSMGLIDDHSSDCFCRQTNKSSK